MMAASLRASIADNRVAGSLANRFRRRRATLFREFLATVPRPCSILDLGGTENFWIQSGLLPLEGASITLLNLTEEPVTQPAFRSLSGSATDLSRFADGSFDIVFSNSVIEHVGSAENQERMAKEALRVGKRFFIQTPARYFLVEPHFHFPFFWHLPVGLRERLACTMPLGWYPKQPSLEEARRFLTNFLLLTKPEFQGLFPGARIVEERVLGMTKSYIAMSP